MGDATAAGALEDGAVPSDIGHLSADWLSATLAAAGIDAPVASMSSSRIGEGVGFIGQLHRLELSYADGAHAERIGAPPSVIAKMPTNDPGGKFIGTMLRLYEKESGFYRHLAERTPMRTARCFYNGVDEPAQSWCLLLEDLRAYEVGDQLTALDWTRTELLVRAMARLHATWSGGRADEHEWLPKVDDPSMTAMVAMFDDAIGPAMDRYGHLVPEHMHDWGPRFKPHALDWVADFAAQPGTIVHGDYRTDNIVFSRADPDDFVALDWQLTCRSPGAYDLYYFLAMCPESDVACGRFDELVDLYLGEVAMAGGTAPSRDVLLAQMRGIGLFFTVLGTVTLSQLDPANERGEQLFLSMWQRGLRFADRIDLRPALP
jgi:hypothetical protein